jgi:hypothetical protein
MDEPLPLKELLDSFESSAKAEAQLSAYYDKIIVLATGGIAGGATVAASLSARLGKLTHFNMLISSLILLGVAVVIALLENSEAAMTAITRFHLVAIGKGNQTEAKNVSVDFREYVDRNPLLKYVYKRRE